MPIKSTDGGDGLYGRNIERPGINSPLSIDKKPFKAGCIKDPPDERDYLVSSQLSNKYKDKNIVDYTSEMSPIKDQGSKGSCVGFAVAAVLEWQQQKEYLNEDSTHKRSEEYYDLSEQWIYHKTKEIDPWGPDTEGTSIRFAMKTIKNKGVPKEEGWPYSDSKLGEPEFWAYSTAKWAQSKRYYRIWSVEEIVQTLREVGPCVLGIDIAYEFYFPDSEGVVSYPVNPDQIYGGHAVCAIGFDEERELIKIKNSWGTGWGNEGFGYLPYSYLRDLMMDAWVTIDENIKSL